MSTELPNLLIRLRAFGARHRGILFWLALVVFGVGLALSFLHMGVDWSGIAPWYLLFDLFILGPVGLFLGSVQLAVYARSAPKCLSLNQAVEICAGGTVANLLPVPAGAMAHGSALVAAGLSLRAAGSIVLYGSLAWLGLGLSVIGIYLLQQSNPIGGVLGLIPCIALAMYGAFCLSRLMPINDICVLILVQLLRIVLLGARFWIVFRGLMESASISEAVLFTGAAIGGVAVSIVPSGLGVSEVLSALLAGLTAVSGAAGFAAMGLIRISSIISAAIVLLTVTVPGRVFRKRQE